MSSIRVLLADGNPGLINLLGDYLGKRRDIDVVARVTDGADVMDAVRSQLPDVIVMDIILPRRDGFMVLEQLSMLDEPSRPKVIILTGLARDDFILRAIRLGAGYYMVKPFDMQLLYDRITEIAREREAIVTETRREEVGESADEKITNLFLTLGIPAHIKGYQYLREAVRMVMDDHTLINRITKELYPGVAKAFATSASKVERAMRHAIEVAWNRGRLETVNHMYGYRVFDKQDKPTNGEFIALVADKIGMKMTA
jgi:two-component system response regulator (stage 0 sporulation protein A)